MFSAPRCTFIGADVEGHFYTCALTFSMGSMDLLSRFSASDALNIGRMYTYTYATCFFFFF